jgi:predicted Zn-ribbon and HTH transcriptional regulator
MKCDLDYISPEEEETLHIIDTQCSMCGYLYAMLDYENFSKCPNCFYIDYY